MTNILMTVTEGGSAARTDGDMFFIYGIAIVLVVLSIGFGYWLFHRKQAEVKDYSINPESHERHWNQRNAA